MPAFERTVHGSENQPAPVELGVARRRFGLPSMPPSAPRNAETDMVEARIRSVSQNRLGQWTFRLEDGAVWVQIDDRRIRPDPRPGQSIAIRRAALGSYLANVNKQVAVRVRRIN